VIPLQYDYAHDFSNGKAQVLKDGKDYYISKPSGQNMVSTSNTALPAASVKALEPPVPMNGVVDPALVGAWLWNPKEGGIATIYKFSGDGTYEFLRGQ
jgi:hypothetical protein